MIYTIGSAQLFKAFASLVLNLIVYPSRRTCCAHLEEQAVETCEHTCFVFVVRIKNDALL